MNVRKSIAISVIRAFHTTMPQKFYIWLRIVQVFAAELDLGKVIANRLVVSVGIVEGAVLFVDDTWTLVHTKDLTSLAT